MKNLLIAGALAFALFSAPVVASETVESVAQLAKDGGGVMEIFEGDLMVEFVAAVGAIVPEGATRAVFVAGKGGAAYGFEMPDGCLTGPIFIQGGIQS